MVLLVRRYRRTPPSQSNVEDVRLMNSTFWSSPLGHALTVGFELRAANIHNIVFQNCDIIKKEAGPALSIDNADLGMVEDIRFENIRVEDGCDTLLKLQVGFFKYSGDCPFEYSRRNPTRKENKGAGWLQVINEKRSQKRGMIRNVLLKNIKVFGDRMPDSEISGWNSDADISNVVFDGVTFQGSLIKTPAAAGLRVQNATNITFVR